MAYTGRARYQQQKVEAEEELAARASDLELATKSLSIAGRKPADAAAGANGAALHGRSGQGDTLAAGAAAGSAAEQEGAAVNPADAGDRQAGVEHASAAMAAKPSPFDMDSPAQVSPAQHGSAHKHASHKWPSESSHGHLPAVPEGSSVEPSVPSGFLHSLSLRRSSRSSGGSSMGRLLLDLLHATNTAAPQRSKELEEELEGISRSGSLHVDRQSVFRDELLRTSLAPQAIAAGASFMTPALTELTDLGSEERDDLVLALLPPYRRTQLRHPVLEGIKEVAIPIVVLAMGLFFSISTLVLLFN